MSYELEKWARMQVVGNPTAKYVLRELTHCHNRETGLCCPSLDTLASVLELSKNTVRTALRYLTDKGFIRPVSIAKSTRVLRTEYYFLVDGKQVEMETQSMVQNLNHNYGANSDISNSDISNIEPSKDDTTTVDVSNSEPSTTTNYVSKPDISNSDISNSEPIMVQNLHPNQEYITKNNINNSKVNISKTTEEKLGGLRGEVQTVDASTEVDSTEDNPTEVDLTEDDDVPPWETQARKQWIAQTSELTSTNTPEPATASTATTAPSTPEESADAPTDSAPASNQGKATDPDYAVVKGMRVPYDAVFDLYNEIAEGHFCTVRDRNKKRKSAIHARLTDLAKLTKADSAEKLLEELRQVLMNGANSSFCCGSKGWRLDFDSAFSPSKFTKLYENGYADSPKESRARPQADQNRPEKLPEVRDMSVDEIMNAHKKHPNYGQ